MTATSALPPSSPSVAAPAVAAAQPAPVDPQALVKAATAAAAREFSEIVPGLFVSNIEMAVDEAALERHDIRLVLTMAQQPAEMRAEAAAVYARLGIQHVELGLAAASNHESAAEVAALRAVWDRAAFCIDGALSARRAALLHCVGGSNRSPATAAYYLVRRRGFTAPQAVALVHARRAAARIEPAWQRRLCDASDAAADSTSARATATQSDEERARRVLPFLVLALLVLVVAAVLR